MFNLADFSTVKFKRSSDKKKLFQRSVDSFILAEKFMKYTNSSHYNNYCVRVDNHGTKIKKVLC